MSSVPIRTMKKEILQKHNKQTQITSVFSSQRAAMQKKNSYQKLAGGPKGRSLDFFCSFTHRKVPKSLPFGHVSDVYLKCIFVYLEFSKKCQIHKDTIQTYKDTIEIHSKTTRYTKIHIRYIMDTLRNSSFCRIEISHNNVRAYTHFPQQQKAMLDLNPCE